MNNNEIAASRWTFIIDDSAGAMIYTSAESDSSDCSFECKKKNKKNSWGVFGVSF